jgi:outer membrane protein assembly factor BamB
MRKVLGLGLPLVCAAMLYAQRAVDWTTHAGDSQRTAWQKNETKITRDSVKNFQLLWKLKLDNEPKALHSLMAPLVLGNLITDRGFKELAIVAGSSDNLFAIDADLGKVFWKKHFTYASDTPQTQQSSWLCPGGLTATPVITPPPTFRRPAAAPAAAAATPPGGRGAPPPSSPSPFPVRSIYVVSSDGNLHRISPTNGEEIEPAMRFLPPNGKPYALNLVDNVLYAILGQGCGGNPNGAYAIDLASPDKKVTSFLSKAGGLWGLAGPAIGSDGTIYAETGDGQWDPEAGKYSDTILALTPRELKLKDYYTPSNREWLTKRDLDLNVTPVVFSYKGRDLLVGGGKEGRLYLLDSTSLGGADHRTPLYRTPLIGNEDIDFAGRGVWGSLASWEDSKGTRWVLSPMWGPLHPEFKFPLSNGEVSSGSIVAFKVEEQNGKTVLAPAWVSRDLIAPTPPVVANGVVFAVSSGEFVRQARENQGGLWTVEDRAARSKHAVLYAFDAETGKELYSSGDLVTSFTHFAALTVANGKVLFGTYDSTVYCFGFPMER